MEGPCINHSASVRNRELRTLQQEGKGEMRIVKKAMVSLAVSTSLLLLGTQLAFGQQSGVQGPFNRMVIRGATMIDGTGAPPMGPVDIVIEGDKIVEVKRFTYAKKNQQLDDKDLLKGATKVIEAQGMYVTPGFINMHTHAYDPYAYLLHLAHGVTTVRILTFDDKSSAEVMKQRELSEHNQIVAPRIRLCQSVAPVNTPQAAREWIRNAKKRGVDCVGEGGPKYRDVMAAYLSEANAVGMPSMIHIGFDNTITARDAAEMGLDEMEHFYALFESLLKDHSLRDYSPDYNENSEDDRYPKVGALVDQSYGPESEQWKELITFFKKKDFILNPTIIIYQFVYDLMKASNADWMAEYAMPQLWKDFEPNPLKHSGVMAALTSVDEARWQRYLNKWMRFIYDYNLAGGRVTVGTDANSVYQLEGFSYIEEMILLQQAGLTPLEVIRSATLYGAESIFQPYKPNGRPIEYGVIRPGLKADLVLMTENPLADFKPMYGTGTVRLDRETEKISRVKSIRYTVKNGVVYDSPELLSQVRQMVEKSKQETGIEVKIPAMLHPDNG